MNDPKKQRIFRTSDGLAHDEVPENSDAAHHILNDYQSTK
jgi:hypothetical protein